MPKEGDKIIEETNKGYRIEREYHAPTPISESKTLAKRYVDAEITMQQSPLIIDGIYLLLKGNKDAASKAWVAQYEGVVSTATAKKAAIDAATNEDEIQMALNR